MDVLRILMGNMGYTSLYYFVMVVCVLAIYYVLPKRIRWISLLAGSVFFYVQIIENKKQIAIFLISIVASYTAGLLLKKTESFQKNFIRKLIFVLGLMFTALPLVLQKFGDFFYESNFVLNTVSWIIPVGLSFYTLQLIAYIVDVYKGKIEPQRNLFKYVLFASFFPQIIQGPIPRYDRLGKQLFDGNKYDFDNIVSGLQLVLWGFFLKFMIADKSAVIVNVVFDNYKAYRGGYILLAAVLYSVQLYTDFLSCTTMSQGVAEMFGIHLDNNFCRPYFSTSIKEFWGRWHMSLSGWLKDYIYIPLGGNRKGLVRKCINLLVTFGVSGIWHGGSWKFLAWGWLHALYQIIGMGKECALKKWGKSTGNSDSQLRILLKRIITFVLVMIAWIIFRAETFCAAMDMIYSMFRHINPWIWLDDSLFRLGLNWKECVVLAMSVCLLIYISYLQEKGIKIREWISKQNIVIRWGLYFSVIWVIWICGSYGYGFDAKDFIYGGF